jgi:hypothetical protein
MPKGTSTDSGLVRLLPITMPGPGTAASGEWCNHGLCIGEDPELFFPNRGNPGIEARQVCAVCRVRDDCLDYAVEADEFGIWGGLDQMERRNLKRRRQRRKNAVQAADRRTEGMA